MQEVTYVLGRVWRHNLTVATAFWALWLGLVSCEIAFGSSMLIGLAFSLSLPLLVGLLALTNMQIMLLVDLRRRVLSLSVLSLAVLLSASVITAVGIVATTSLKQLTSL